MMSTPAFRRAQEPREDLAGMWILHTDGGCWPNPGGPTGIGFVLTNPDGKVAYEEGRSVPKATNNVAEYQALIEGLKMAQVFEVPTLKILSDSQLLVFQMQGKYRVKNPGLRLLHGEATTLARSFRAVVYVWIPREENTRADALAALGMSHDPEVFEMPGYDLSEGDGGR